MLPLFIPSYIKKHLKPNQRFIDEISTIKNKIKELSEKEATLVSIIIPAFNEAENILRTLASLSDSKTKYAIEIIVVDNNSADNTKEMVMDSGANYLFEASPGVKNARNKGLSVSKGVYIVNADADSVYSPFWIDALIDPLVRNEAIAVTHGKFSFLPEASNSRAKLFLYEVIGNTFKKINGMLKDNAMYVYGCSSAYRKEQGLAVGSYDHPPGANEDGYLAFKLRNKYGRLKQITNKNSYVWTSSRKFGLDGTLSNRIKKKAGKIFNNNRG